MAQGSTFPTPFNINRIQGIPGPKGDPGSAGAQGPGQGIDCTAHGCVGDGTTDNTAGFANASAAAAADPSRVVYVPQGTYKLASTQSLTANLKFAPGAMIKPAAGQTITVSGQIAAGDYQQIFDVSLGGTIKVATSKVSAGWFGIDPSFTNAINAGATNQAIAAAVTGQTTGFGPIRRRVFIPTGHYKLEKPIVIPDGNYELCGEGYNATCLEASGYIGPCIVANSNAPMVQHLNDYAGLASCEINGAAVISLNHYGWAWNLQGVAQFSADFIINIATQASGDQVILSSSGSDETNVQHTCFALWTLVSDFSTSNVGLRFDLTTSGGSVSVVTSAGALNTTGFHHLRFDYDGAHMRIFVDGVSQSITTSGAQTGTLAQHKSESVRLGRGLQFGWDGYNPAFNPPDGCRMASLRMGWASRGSSNFTPPAGKYTEDGSTKFLMNFDTIDANGALMFARTWTDNATGAMSDAWLGCEAGGSQIGQIQIHDLSAVSSWGKALLAVACPDMLVSRCFFQGPFACHFDNNCYNAVLRDCHIGALGQANTHSIPLKIGSACNFFHIVDCLIRAGDVCLYAECNLAMSGHNYIIVPKYACIYLETCFSASFSGSLFLSDEGGPDNPYSCVIKGAGAISFHGTLFGSQGFADQLQCYISNVQSQAGFQGSRVNFTGCTFTGNVSSAPPVKLVSMTASDEVTFIGCDSVVEPMYQIDSSGPDVQVRVLSDGPQWRSPTSGLWGKTGQAVQADLPAPVTTTDATPTTLFSFAMADLTDLRMDVIVKAKDLTNTSKGASWNLSADYRRNGGAPAIDGTLTKVANGSNTGAPPAGVDCTITTSGNNVIVQATGDASDHYKWLCVPQEVTVT